jgi:hypothetical protein
MIRMWMRRENYLKLMIDQHRKGRTECIVLESVKIGQYISDVQNTIMAKQIERQMMYPNRKLYLNRLKNLSGKHK